MSGVRVQKVEGRNIDWTAPTAEIGVKLSGKPEAKVVAELPIDRAMRAEFVSVRNAHALRPQSDERNAAVQKVLAQRFVLDREIAVIGSVVEPDNDVPVAAGWRALNEAVSMTMTVVFEELPPGLTREQVLTARGNFESAMTSGTKPVTGTLERVFVDKAEACRDVLVARNVGLRDVGMTIGTEIGYEMITTVADRLSTRDGLAEPVDHEADDLFQRLGAQIDMRGAVEGKELSQDITKHRLNIIKALELGQIPQELQRGFETAHGNIARKLREMNTPEAIRQAEVFEAEVHLVKVMAAQTEAEIKGDSVAAVDQGGIIFGLENVKALVMEGEGLSAIGKLTDC